jgi:hypothetical protein
VLGNDLNLLGGTTASLVSDVTHGELVLLSNGAYVYEPDPGFVGTDSFRYRPSGLLSTAATATITVTNAKPVAVADSYTWPGGTLVIAAPGVLANDLDADGDPLIAELDGGGISGSFDLDEDGGFRYSPGGGFSGSGTVSYRVWDGLRWSNTATITLTIAAVPTPFPTPTSTPRPSLTPRPTPTPPPSLPLPSIPEPLSSLLPLPSIPVPLPSALPLPSASPLPQPSTSPSASATPAARSSSAPGEGSERPSASAEPDADGVTGPLPGGLGPSSTGSGSSANAAGGAELRLARNGGDQLTMLTGPLGLLGGLEIWAVPAATMGVSGLLVLIWVALQTGGALIWMPAVRRLRGKEEPAAA